MAKLTDNPVRVAVASFNRAKLAAVRRIFGMLWPAVSVYGVRVEVPAYIGEMPLGWQVREGAVLRAKEALKRADPSTAFGVGAEGGVEFEGDAAFLLNWVAVEGCDGTVSTAPSAKLRLPPALGTEIKKGGVLGELMIAKTGQAAINENEGAVGYFTKGILSRQSFFEGCLACALAPFLHPDEYGDPS